MTRFCKDGKHIMIPKGDSGFDICKICKRYFMPTWDFSIIKENNIKICRFCNKRFEICICKER